MFNNSFNFSDQTNLNNASNSNSITDNPLIIFGISVASFASFCLLSCACHKLLSEPIKSYLGINQQSSANDHPDPQTSSPRFTSLQSSPATRYNVV